MLRTKIYMSICALTIMVLFGVQVFASEITGTLNTSGIGNVGNENVGNGENNGNTPPTFSEVSGNLSVGTGATSQISGTVQNPPAQNTSPQNPVIAYTGSQSSSQSAPAPSPTPTPTATMTADAENNEDVLDTILSLGSRFTPEAPDAGPFGLDFFGNDSDQYTPSLALIRGFGQNGNLDENESLAASALSSASGLSLAQLLYIALVGLFLLASMGYAISRTGGGPTTA